MRAGFFLLLGGLVLGLNGCGLDTKAAYKNREREEMYKQGSVLSDEGGVDLFGPDRKATPEGLTVNAYLWRAALDAISFMPLASTDPFGGVILTDWYSQPNQSNERLKLTVMVLDRNLRADGVRVTAFKQTRTGDQWVDAAVNPQVARALEDAILTRARQMRASHQQQP